MIGPYTRLTVSDNSGAITLGCISVPKLFKRTGPKAGQVFTASVKENIFKKHIKKKSRIITKSQIVCALVLTTARPIKRVGNFFVSSTLNTAMLLNQFELPYGNSVYGPAFRELRQKVKYRKFINMLQILL